MIRIFGRLSLSEKLLGSTQLATTIVVLALGLFFIHRENQLLQLSGRELTEQAAALVGFSAAKAIVSGDREAASGALMPLATLPGIQRAWLVDSEGRIWARFDNRHLPKDQSEKEQDPENPPSGSATHPAESPARRAQDPHSPLVASEAASPSGLWGSVGNPDPHPQAPQMNLVWQPIEYQGQTVGSVLMALDTIPVRKRPRQHMLLVVGGALAALLVSILASRAVFETVANRLHNLSEGAQRLARGELSTRVRQAGTDEIGQLAKSFNAMAASIEATNARLTTAYERLRESQAQVQQYAEGLEILVDERTRELRAAKELAEAASVAKSEFLANISHELRTPLTGIIGLADTLFFSPLAPEHKEHLKNILECGNNLLALMNNILDFSKMESGRMELKLGAFWPVRVARRAVSMFASKAEQHGLSLQLHAEGDGSLPMLGDEQRLLQVLLNLVSNAVKFTEQGGVEVRVSISPTSEEDARRVIFEITDTGIGIPEDKTDLIFESFTQADGSTARSYGGTGLGLSISRKLTAMMNGELSVKSHLGEGSTFTLALTMQLASEAEGFQAA